MNNAISYNILINILIFVCIRLFSNVCMSDNIGLEFHVTIRRVGLQDVVLFQNIIYAICKIKN